MQRRGLEGQVDLALQVIASADARSGTGLPEIQWYKRSDKKCVFRFGEECVAKVVRLNSIHERLKYRRYARDEAANLITAAERGMCVPEVFAVGHIRRMGLVSHAVLIMSDIAGRRTVRALLEEAADDGDRTEASLAAVLPLFERLYRAGCNHVDVHVSNILVDQLDPSNEPALVDFKFAQFHRKPSVEILMLEAARFFSEGIAATIEPALVERWLNALFDRIEVEGAGRREFWRQRFRHYRGRTLTRKQRQRIDPYPPCP